MPKPDKPAPSVKHPHVRGEDSSHFFPLAPTIETPPRAWGRPPPTPCRFATTRNTPTCVGKTLDADRAQAFREKHPHVRGEDISDLSTSGNHGETPPRAWGRLQQAFGHGQRCRNTPTCVGKTCHWRQQEGPDQKHPHVRGEDAYPQTLSQKAAETPPRAWGRH